MVDHQLSLIPTEHLRPVNEWHSNASSVVYQVPSGAIALKYLEISRVALAIRCIRAVHCMHALSTCSLRPVHVLTGFFYVVPRLS